MSVLVRDLGRSTYGDVFHAMQTFTDERSASTDDEIWFTEHEPVFTQGQAGKAEHLVMPGDIPVVQSDRGGQVTYHGPGQIVGYVLLDLRRNGLTVRDLVSGLERAMMATLQSYGVEGYARPDAPGVYVSGNKIGSLGLRVRRGCSYHGLSLNVQMALEPFSRINPCGLTDVGVTQLSDLASDVAIDEVCARLLQQLLAAYALGEARWVE